MKKQFVIFRLLLVVLFLNLTFLSNAQFRIGVEAGAVVSSVFSATAPIQLYQPRVGATGGIFVEKDFTSFFALRAGTYYNLKGAYARNAGMFYWNIHCLTIPLIATFTPVKPIRLGIGLETSVFLGHDHPMMKLPIMGLGARAEVGWQISKIFRLIGHFTYDFTSILEVYYTDAQGNVVNNGNPAGYTNISGGLTLACTIKTFEKKNVKMWRCENVKM